MPAAVPVFPVAPEGYKWSVVTTVDPHTGEMLAVPILVEEDWNESIGIAWIGADEEGAGALGTGVLWLIVSYLRRRRE
tara:strand:+ start:1039 stop:1272 length:234 start_codon:yes stop_codon:yes gene_type:complete